MNDNVIYRQVRRPDVALIARAAACAMSDLYEALPPTVRDAALMRSTVRAIARGIRAAGPAVTARCAAGDNLMMHRALLLAKRGDVLVVDAGTPSGAQWGKLAAVYADRKGLAGVIVDGCIRDVDYLREQKCAVWCTDISPTHPTKRGPGAVNVPVTCGGVQVRPGDLISADGDGVLVIPREALQLVVEQAEQRERHERDGIAAITGGRSLFEIHELQAAVDASGVQELDAAWDDPR